jgi:hypothetical protein
VQCSFSAAAGGDTQFFFCFALDVSLHIRLCRTSFRGFVCSGPFNFVVLVVSHKALSGFIGPEACACFMRLESQVIRPEIPLHYKVV